MATPSTAWRPKAKCFDPATDFGEHVHDVISLTLTLRGGYEEEFEGEVHRCGPLSVQLKPSRVPHTTVSEAGAELRIVHVPVEAVGCARFEPATRVSGVASAIALGAFAALRSGARPDARFGALLRGMAARSIEAAPPPPGWILAAERRLSAELLNPPRLAELARDADVHPVYFARVFRRVHGTSVDGWIRRARAERAVSLLAGTPAAISAVALQLGYYDQSHFGGDFRRETGWSPAALRRALEFQSS